MDTTRERSKSHLFPAIASVTSFPNILRSSFTQFCTFKNESLSVISYTSNAPEEE